MSRKLMVVAVLLMLAVPAGAGAQAFPPGSPGLGDPYFPLDGNGGYDVGNYLLDVRYEPATDHLRGVATISATATQDLSRFDLDLHGLKVRAIAVDGEPATWTRDEDELVVTPATGIPSGSAFTTVVRYDGVPETIGDGQLGLSGFVHTDDGALVAGQPEVADTWFPVNDHPLDKASYLFRITVPRGTKAIANGELIRKRYRNDETITWVWRAKEPMASYLATATIGQFIITRSDAGGRRSYNAIDPVLFKATGPHGGQRYAISQNGDNGYRRFSRATTIPAGGATMSFWVNRDTEPTWDYFMVEAKTSGGSDWTTLEDLNGHTSQDTGNSCPSWHDIHPFLAHYQTDNGDGTCSPTGTTGEWHAASGTSDGYEQWKVDLSPWAGKKVRIALTYVSDETVQHRGVFVDDIEVEGATGSTTFESDAGGWAVYAPPADSPGNDTDWVVGTKADEPPTYGAIAKGSLERQPEIIAFLEDFFGPYPFSTAGGIVDNDPGIGFALENQTRPIYSKDFFYNSESGDSVVVHETAHQWTGDDLALKRWADIWLNEGFATYTEWLWSEHEGGVGPDTYLAFYYSVIPAGDPFWSLEIGDPGPDLLFEQPVYLRGGMTLQALRQTIGDEAFFQLVRAWVDQHRRGNVDTSEFIALAESISGQDLGAFFDDWLYSDEKPTLGVDDITASKGDAARGAGAKIPVPGKAVLRK